MQETRRIARLLEIISFIQGSPRRWSRKRLADEFEVSERSITSDLQVIRHGLGWDLRVEPGGGYYFGRSVPRLPSVSYSIPEALSLLLAVEAGFSYGGVQQEELSAAVRRLTSVFPKDLRRIVEHLEQGSPPQTDGRRTQALTKVLSAISNGRRLHLVYKVASRGGDMTERDVDPYGIVPYERTWHLIGYCHLRQTVRVFKVDRIRSIEILPQSFVAPVDFNTERFLASGWGLMRGLDLPVDKVALRFTPPAADWVAEGEWFEGEHIEHEPDGSVVYRATIQVTPEFQRWVLRYGQMVEVNSPDHLRDWIVAEARATIERTSTKA
ncbi:MAG: WYL domain-containing protein [Thermomicrobiales bacterium]|nr:WYL domain-containing protein [Thermomicrobiales bacterium]